jgi:hypothetical protein
VSQRGMLGVKVGVLTGCRAVHAGRHRGAVIDQTVELAAAMVRVRAVGRLTGSAVAQVPTDADARAGVPGEGRHHVRSVDGEVFRIRLSVRSSPPVAKATLDCPRGGSDASVRDDR